MGLPSTLISKAIKEKYNLYSIYKSTHLVAAYAIKHHGGL